MEEVIGVASWQNTTTIHPIGLIVLSICGGILLVVPRRYATLPILIVACFVAPAQRVVLFGLDFNLLRVMVLVGWIRILARREFHLLSWHKVDTLTIAWAISQTTIYTIQYGTTDALVNRAGTSFDAVGMYLLFRMIVRSWEDVLATLRGVVWIGVPILVAFIVENRTGRNLFAFLGGVPEFTVIREGRLRCQGAFSHAILAGTFWAALAPMIGALWWRTGTDRLYAIIGVLICVSLVGLSASSTPVAAVIFGLMGTLVWPLRHRMREVRWILAGTLILLHLIMQKPVWHLLARIDLVGGSTGYHRYHLFDQFLRRFGEWWLLGTQSTGHWGLGLDDVTNQYVLEGVVGGLLTLSIFVAIVVLAFREIGLTWRRVGETSWRVALAWSLGVSLFVHVTAFFAVSYFGQIIVVWHMLLATIISMGILPTEDLA